jgi:hypothetical protein
MIRTGLLTIAVLAGLAAAAAAAAPSAPAGALIHHVQVPQFHRHARWLPLPPYGPAPQELPPPGTPYLAPATPPSSPGGAPLSTLTPTLPEGMTITITRVLRDTSETVSPSSSQADSQAIALPKQAAQHLADCWSPPPPPPGDTVEVTLRFGFNSSGAVLWPPRITYVKSGPGMSAEDVRASILNAFKACTPLHFTPAMAANIPGEPISVRFIGRREQETGADH